MARSALTLMFTLTVMGRVASVDLFQRPKDQDKCKCKNWKSEYKHETAECGKGKEYFPVEENAPSLYRTDSEKVATDLCTHFYHNLDSHHCVNLNLGKDNGTWCYTDPMCNDLNGGGRIAGMLSWKICKNAIGGRPADLKLRDYSLDDLEDIAKKKDIWLAGLVKLSYPGSRADKGSLVNLTDLLNNTDSLPESLVSRAKEFGNGNEAVWFDTNKDAKVPIVIVTGTKAYKVDKALHQDPMHPGTWSTFECIVGCRGQYYD